LVWAAGAGREAIEVRGWVNRAEWHLADVATRFPFKRKGAKERKERKEVEAWYSN